MVEKVSEVSMSVAMKGDSTPDYNALLKHIAKKKKQDEGNENISLAAMLPPGALVRLTTPLVQGGGLQKTEKQAAKEVAAASLGVAAEARQTKKGDGLRRQVALVVAGQMATPNAGRNSVVVQKGEVTSPLITRAAANASRTEGQSTTPVAVNVVTNTLVDAATKLHQSTTAQHPQAAAVVNPGIVTTSAPEAEAGRQEKPFRIKEDSGEARRLWQGAKQLENVVPKQGETAAQSRNSPATLQQLKTQAGLESGVKDRNSVVVQKGEVTSPLSTRAAANASRTEGQSTTPVAVNVVTNTLVDAATKLHQSTTAQHPQAAAVVNPGIVTTSAPEAEAGRQEKPFRIKEDSGEARRLWQGAKQLENVVPKQGETAAQSRNSPATLQQLKTQAGLESGVKDRNSVVVQKGEVTSPLSTRAAANASRTEGQSTTPVAVNVVTNTLVDAATKLHQSTTAQHPQAAAVVNPGIVTTSAPEAEAGRQEKPFRIKEDSGEARPLWQGAKQLENVVPKQGETAAQSRNSPATLQQLKTQAGLESGVKGGNEGQTLEVNYQFQRWSGDHSVRISVPTEARREGNVTLLPSDARAADVLLRNMGYLTGLSPDLLRPQQEQDEQQQRLQQQQQDEDQE